jgi:head-tail adaptor
VSEFAGSLRERVTIERRDTSRDALGGANRRYVYDGAAWVAVRPIVQGGLIAADAISALPRWQVTMRKREEIGPWTRFVWRGKFLVVRGVECDPREVGIMLLSCDEVR